MSEIDSSMDVLNFLNQLPAERRTEVERVRELIRHNLAAGFEEVVNNKTLIYQVPLSRYRDTYNKQPLWYVALASQKSYLSLHLMPVYGDAGLLKRLEEGFKIAGKKLNMGKACIHFKRAEDLALDVIGEIVAGISMERWVEIAKAAWKR